MFKERRQRALKTFVLLILLAMPSQGLSIALPIRGRVPIHSKVPKSVENILKARARNILDLAKAKKLELRPGRKSFLLKMAHDPAQWAKVQKISSFTIGDKIISRSKCQVLLLENELENYINKVRPDLINTEDEGRIGPFWHAEILYAVLQNFSKPTINSAFSDPRLQDGEYVLLPDTVRQRVTIGFEPMCDDVLTVSFTSRRILEKLDSKKIPLDLISRSKVYFNLKSGEINLQKSYLINGAY